MTEMHKYTIDIPIEHWEFLKEGAKEEGMKLADYIRKLLSVVINVEKL